MRGFLILAAMIAAGSVTDSFGIEPERHLPRGEEHPAVIESLYDSPFGEVQFTRIGLDIPLGHSGFLRNGKGTLIGFKEVRGPAFCENWFQSNKTEALPGGCEFVFHDEHTGREIGVRSAEMFEASIFQTTKGKMRDLEKAMNAKDATNIGGAKGASGGPHVAL